MGSTAYGDLTSGAVGTIVISHASVASDGAAAKVLEIGALVNRAPQNMRLVSAWWEPTGADSSAASAVSYRTLNIVNGGADGTGTTVIASVNLTASQASNTQKALTLVATPSLSTGEVIFASYSATAGAADATHTKLFAGNFRVAWRPI